MTAASPIRNAPAAIPHLPGGAVRPRVPETPMPAPGAPLNNRPGGTIRKVYPSINFMFPGVGFTGRQRSLANRLLDGERIRFEELRRFDQQAALQLAAKGVVTFAPVTNRLALAMPPSATPDR